MPNYKLSDARRNKKDEFYTQLSDIENELRHYHDHFEGKTVYCNCDDPRISNFFYYFVSNFEFLKLKKLITTCYKNQQPNLFSTGDSEEAVFLEYEGKNGTCTRNNPLGLGMVRPLKGNGDFRNAECIELLKQADIVVTNPPFSLFREYVNQIIKHEKKFLIIGHQNAITYKEIFPLIKENKIWLGHGFRGGAGHFISQYENYATATDQKEGMIRVSGVHWFTNLSHEKRYRYIYIYMNYSPEKYPHYDNYDAIEVSRVVNIPCDWDGKMGVPITFLDKYNPDQFEILGYMANTKIDRFNFGYPYVNKKRKYARIIIRRK